MYPLDKYRYYTTDNNRVIAVSTYAGKTVRGVAKCAPGDSFDLTKGKELAAARCAQKAASRREKRAASKLLQAQAQLEAAKEFYAKMQDYYKDARVEHMNANARITNLMDTM